MEKPYDQALRNAIIFRKQILLGTGNLLGPTPGLGDTKIKDGNFCLSSAGHKTHSGLVSGKNVGRSGFGQI